MPPRTAITLPKVIACVLDILDEWFLQLNIVVRLCLPVYA
ncbi:hypothetical protein GPAL_3797 [Glaciecola pallidula DSM 14239 = ACAM 615]|uniref:Uncharacterized protein n=1 Tax=Brumicola pallidula DSM 14239 = ACAM 615 TaxID=1121922 RepID=K6ZJW9_9ALTE|nr:hypothetical protein GPAL_3797 [Glaciecola pallidula DSM 14239 = ACAM 615]